MKFMYFCLICKSVLGMGCRFLIFFLLIVSVNISYTQNPATTVGLLKSTMTSIGGVGAVAINSKQSIIQSVGQQGIIGAKNSDIFAVQQGFLTNAINFKINNTGKETIEEKLNLVISPNPFIDHIKIDFSRKTEHEILIQIFDLNGRSLLSQNHPPSESIIVPIENYAVATYIVAITSGIDNFTKKIIKTTH